MGRGHWRSLVIVVVGAALVASCSTTVTGTPQADPAAEVKPDTGGYPTTPRDVPVRQGLDRRVQASYELGGVLISPSEVDRRFDQAAIVEVPVFPTQTALVLEFGVVAGQALAADDSYVGGAVSASQTEPAEKVGDAAPSMATYVIRYRSPGDAAKAGTALRALSDSSRGLVGRTGAFHGSGTARAGTTVWWVQRDDYLIGASFRTIDEAAADRLAARWFDLQLPRLGDIRLSPQQLLDLPPDRESIMSLTMPNVVMQSDGVQLTLAYLTPRAFANAVTGSWSEGMTLMDRAGIDLIGYAGTKVFRARDEASARYYADSPRQSAADQKSEPAASPRAVPDSTCTRVTTIANGDPRDAYICSVVVGRYVLESEAVSSLTQAQQQVAASYLIAKAAK